MTVVEYFEDYVVGATRVTTGRTITETDVVIHAGHSGDFFPHHMDEEFARTTPFGRRIAHGTMTFAIGIGLTASQIKCLSVTPFTPASPSRKRPTNQNARTTGGWWKLAK